MLFFLFLWMKLATSDRSNLLATFKPILTPLWSKLDLSNPNKVPMRLEVLGAYVYTILVNKSA
jgi:hypothetical protein